MLSVPDLPVRVNNDLDLLLASYPDVAVVATTSLLTELAPTALALLASGISVVSICEELSCPYESHPDLARQLDRAARDSGATLLGTGVNPGLLMDTLPLALSSLLTRVDRIEVQRAADMSGYDGIVSKFGLGLTRADFEAQVAAGQVTGHHGFAQSLAELARGLGIAVNAYEVGPVQAALITSMDRTGRCRRLRAGSVAVVQHQARALAGGRPVIELSAHFGFFLPGDPIPLGDHWRLEGKPRDIEFSAPTGIDSFHSTVSVTANVATAVPAAPPGLITMADLPVTALASKGSLLA